MHKRSIHIEDVLDDCIAAVHEHGRTVADCLAHYPDLRTELEPLLNLAVRLQSARTLQAPPEFRRLSIIRVSNLLVARQNQAGRSVTLPDPLGSTKRDRQDLFGVGRKLTVTVIASVILAVLLLLGHGVVRASADDLPGDALYPVKRAIEEVRLAISLDDANDAGLHLAFAARRLDEAAALLEEDKLQAAGQALNGYDERLESIIAFLNHDSDLSTGEQINLANQLLTVQAAHEERFAVLLDQVSQDARPAVELSLATSRAMRDQALRVLSKEPGEPELPYESPEDSRTATPQPSQRLPSNMPSRTPAPTHLFTPSP
jgi:hypothetical protein